MSDTPAPIEVLKQHFPLLYEVHMTMLNTAVGGGGEQKLPLLLDTLMKYNRWQYTGAINIDFSKGRISTIDTRIRITANTTPLDR